MFELYGILIYDILENGNLLRGDYTNNNGERMQGIIMFEVAREEARKTDGQPGLGGVYVSRYNITGNGETFVRRMEIQQVNGAFRFIWRIGGENGPIEFEGMGMMVGQNHIAVSYIEPRN